jgi:catechol 2,3-dioxygenase-like lactoylglutathione lyase family enzyme
VPVLVIHGDADQVLPLDKTAGRLPGLVKDMELVVMEGGPHAIPWTHADQVDIVPVSDVDRAKEFYQHLGWRFDDDVAPLDGLRIVQFTPPGSGASITFGTGLTTAAPGSAGGGLIVSDIEAARDELAGRGIDASEIWHGPPFPPEARQPGPDPERTSYGSFFSFSDPDGNTWLVQEATTRLPGRIDAAGTAFASAADLASALRRAEAAHREHEKRAGRSRHSRPPP